MRFLETIAPGEFARYFAEAVALLPDEETARQLADFHERYGFELDPDSVPRLVEQHGLEA